MPRCSGGVPPGSSAWRLRVRVDPRPQVGVAGTAAQQPAGRVRILVQVDAMAFGQPGGQQVLEHRPQLAVVEALAGDRAVHDEAAVRVAAQRRACGFSLAFFAVVRRQLGSRERSTTIAAAAAATATTDKPRPAGHEVAGRGRHHDHDARDDEFRSRPAPRADRAVVLRSRRLAAAPPGWVSPAWSCARPACSGLPRSRLPRSRWSGLGGFGFRERGGQLVQRLFGRVALPVAERMAGEPGLVEQRGQPRGGGRRGPGRSPSPGPAASSGVSATPRAVPRSARLVSIAT